MCELVHLYWYTVKPVYKGQPQLQNYKSGLCWQLTFVWSVRNYLSDKLRLTFVDRWPLFAGVLMHRFYCIRISSSYRQRSLWARKFSSRSTKWKFIVLLGILTNQCKYNFASFIHNYISTITMPFQDGLLYQTGNWR